MKINGEMSCWYLFSALGFYPLCPGHPSYVFGSPLFKHARLNLPNGKELLIQVQNNSPENMYVHNIRRNGSHIEEYLSHMVSWQLGAR